MLLKINSCFLCLGLNTLYTLYIGVWDRSPLTLACTQRMIGVGVQLTRSDDPGFVLADAQAEA